MKINLIRTSAQAQVYERKKNIENIIINTVGGIFTGISDFQISGLLSRVRELKSTKEIEHLRQDAEFKHAPEYETKSPFFGFRSLLALQKLIKMRLYWHPHASIKHKKHGKESYTFRYVP